MEGAIIYIILILVISGFSYLKNKVVGNATDGDAPQPPQPQDHERNEAHKRHAGHHAGRPAPQEGVPQALIDLLGPVAARQVVEQNREVASRHVTEQKREAASRHVAEQKRDVAARHVAEQKRTHQPVAPVAKRPAVATVLPEEGQRVTRTRTTIPEVAPQPRKLAFDLHDKDQLRRAIILGDVLQPKF